MRELGITRAHIVGHSSSVPALQLALDAPEGRAHPHPHGGRPAPRPPTPRPGTDVVLAAVQRYRAGDKAGAVDIFFRGVFGPGYRAGLDHGLPGAFEQAVADADAFFTPGNTRPSALAVHRRRRAPHPAASVTVPGMASSPTFAERQKLLLHWLPNAVSHLRPARPHPSPARAGPRAAVAWRITGFSPATDTRDTLTAACLATGRAAPHRADPHAFALAPARTERTIWCVIKVRQGDDSMPHRSAVILSPFEISPGGPGVLRVRHVADVRLWAWPGRCHREPGDGCADSRRVARRGGGRLGRGGWRSRLEGG